MTIILSVVVGILFSAGFYLILRRSVMRVVIGVAILTNATNLLVFTAGGLFKGGAPLVQAGETTPAAGYADPMPQAFILTAIVIGLGVLAFFVALAMRVYQAVGLDDTDSMKATDS